MNFKKLVLKIVRVFTLIDETLCKTLICAKMFPLISGKMDGFTRNYKGIKHLALFGSEKYNGTLYNGKTKIAKQ